MGRPPRQHQQDRALALGVLAQVLDGRRCLSRCVIAVPTLPGRVIVAVVRRLVVVVRALQGQKILEALPPLGRNVRRPPVTVQVPLADVTGAVALLGQHFGDRYFGTGQLHVVQEHTVRERPSPRH